MLCKKVSLPKQNMTNGNDKSIGSLKQLSRVESSWESSRGGNVIATPSPCHARLRHLQYAFVRVALMAGKSPTINAQHVGADKARSLSTGADVSDLVAAFDAF